MKWPALTSEPLDSVVSFGISPPFGRLSPTQGQITYVLLTRAPLYRGLLPFSLDLHVLGAPLTFVLSQDQTLQLNLEWCPKTPFEPYEPGLAKARFDSPSPEGDRFISL